MAEKRKMELSPAERRRRSELARQLHKKVDPLTGRPLLGGAQPGAGRPKKRRATEIINERIEDHADEIFTRLLDVLRSKKNFEALGAAKQLMEITKMETEFQQKEARELDDTPTEELVELVASRLARLAESGEIPFDIEEADVVEVSPEALARGDEGEGQDDGAEDGPQGSSEDREAGTGSGTASPFGRAADRRRTS